MERSQRLWRENTLNLGPLKNEIINFLFIAVVKGRNENVALYWRGRRLRAIKCGQGRQIVAVVRHCAFLRLLVGRASWITQGWDCESEQVRPEYYFTLQMYTMEWWPSSMGHYMKYPPVDYAAVFDTD